jgi:hypothetical protein
METLAENAPEGAAEAVDYLALLSGARARFEAAEADRAALIAAARAHGHLTYRAIGQAVGLSHAHASNLARQARA